MPTYDFCCKKCEVIHEVFMTLDEIEKKLECPDCGETLMKMVSMPAIKVS